MPNLLPTDAILENFEKMPRQLQLLARYIIDFPEDIAFISMRELARRVGVAHTTVERLAHILGYDGYHEFREKYIEALREQNIQNSPLERKQNNKISYLGGIADFFSSELTKFSNPAFSEQLATAAATLVSARHIFCIGLRSQHAPAHQFAYALSYFHRHVILLDGVGGTGADALVAGGSKDALLAISVAPYTRLTIETAQQAAKRGIALVAITDSRASPLARLARNSILVSSSRKFFFQSVTPIFVATEMLASTIALKMNARSDEPAKLAQARFDALDIYWKLFQ